MSTEQKARRAFEEEQEREVRRETYEYVYRRKMPLEIPIEEVILYIAFPLEAYWRKASVQRKVEGRVVNVEGLIHPSFSGVIFPIEYKVSMEDEKNFLIEKARGYAPCPVCGRTIKAEIENEKFTVNKPIKNFTREVAYEMAISQLAYEIAPRMKSHVEAKHNMKFTAIDKSEILIVRYVGGEEVVTTATIAKYRCEYDEADDLMGVNGILEHVINSHENVHITKKVKAFVEDVTATTEWLLGLGKEKIPIVGAHRSTFYYILSDRGNPGINYKILDRTYFRAWLHMSVVERKDRVDLVITADIPRPLRLIYHYPLFRYVPHAIAYKMNAEQYERFMNRVRRELRRRGYPTENLEKMYEFVTGGLVYTYIEPRHAFGIDLDTLRSLKDKVAQKREDLSVFLSHRVV